MATATRQTVGRPITDYVQVIVLEMSLDEAQAIRDVLHRVGGSPDKSRRGLTNAVASALIEAGIRFNANDAEGSIYFKDQK